MNNLPKVVAQQRRGRASNPRLLDLKSDALPLSHRATPTIAVSSAISKIFSIKEWPDLEIWVWGRSRTFKMAQFDKPCTTFYWSAIVTIALSCTIFELFDVE